MSSRRPSLRRNTGNAEYASPKYGVWRSMERRERRNCAGREKERERERMKRAGGGGGEKRGGVESLSEQALFA